MCQGEMIIGGALSSCQLVIISMFFVGANLVFAPSVWGEHKETVSK
jgi:hypothetical protein